MIHKSHPGTRWPNPSPCFLLPYTQSKSYSNYYEGWKKGGPIERLKGNGKKSLIKLCLITGIIARCIFCETFISWRNKRCKGIFLPNHLEVELLTNRNWSIFVHHNILWIIVLRLILTPYHLFIILNNHFSISFSLVELGIISHSYHFVLLQCFQRNMS
jgi:hypothetical protein